MKAFQKYRILFIKGPINDTNVNKGNKEGK